jgi:hypothetical protein
MKRNQAILSPTSNRESLLFVFPMKHYAIRYFVLLAILVNFSCTKEDIYADEFMKRWRTCKNGGQPGQPETYAQLLGEWKLIAFSPCAECLPETGRVRPTDRNVKLIFSGDSTLTVYEDGQQVVRTPFSVQPASHYAGHFTLSAPAGSLEYISWNSSIIEFCEDLVSFSTGIMDGSTYYFQRVTDSDE